MSIHADENISTAEVYADQAIRKTLQPLASLLNEDMLTLLRTTIALAYVEGGAAALKEMREERAS